MITITGIAPAQGSTAGETAVTITGTGFLPGTVVGFDGTLGTAFSVVNATTVTCVTPAGTGVVDVAVAVSGSSAVLSGAFTYFAPPTITGFDMPASSNFGGTMITIMGTGFTANAASTNTVTIGGTPATNVTPTNDTTLTCVTPAGPAGPNPVVLTNANGVAMSTYQLFEPILVADGGGSPVPTTWDLWAFDPVTHFSHMVGPIGFGVTSMDFDPNGNLYGATAPGALGPPRQLIQIDPATGTGTLIGSTDDVGTANHLLQGAAFVGPTLFGYDGPGANYVSVDTTTALVTVVTPGQPLSPGGGFAVDAANTAGFYMAGDTGSLFSANLATGVLTPGPLLNGFTQVGGRLKAATFHLGVLYANSAVSPGGGGSNRQIVTVDPVTGLIVTVGPALMSPYASAIASRTR